MTSVAVIIEQLKTTVRTLSFTFALAALLVVCPKGNAQVLKTTLTLETGCLGLPTTDVETNSVTNKTYVLINAGCNFPSVLYVIDGATNTSKQIENNTTGSIYSSLKIDTATNKIYLLGGPTAGYIGVIDGASDTFARINLGDGQPHSSDAAVDEDTNTLYLKVHGTDTGAIEAVDGTTFAIIATIPVDKNAFEPFALDSVHKRIYGINLTSKESAVLSLDLATRTIVKMEGSPSDIGPAAVAVDPGLNRIYLSNNNSVYPYSGIGTVAVFDGASQKLITTRYAGGSDLFVNQTSHFVYYIGHDSTTGFVGLGELDGATLSPPYLIPLADGKGHDVGAFDFSPFHISIDEGLNKVYVTNGGQGSYMKVVNGQTSMAAAIDGANLSLGGSMSSINSKTHAVYVIGSAHAVASLPMAVIDGTGGSTAVASVYPKSLTFSGKVGTQSLPQTVYAANVGSQPMEVSNLIFTGVDYKSIRQSNDCANPIQPGQICAINLVFSPGVDTPESDANGYAIDVAAPGSGTSTVLNTTVTQ